MAVALIVFLILILVLYALLLRRTVFILAYHSVGPERLPGSDLVVSLSAFGRQLRLLSALGLRAENLDDLVKGLARGKRRNGPALCITFDDGYRGVLEAAAPQLQKMNWPATLFVPSAHVGKTNQWDADTGSGNVPLLNWEELRRLMSMGFHIGSHGRNHLSSIKISADECFQELTQSLADLNRELRQTSRVFCYPFGHRNPEVETLVRRAGYEGACSLVHDAYPNNLYDLGRLNVRTNNLVGFAFSLAAYPIVSAGRRLIR